MDIGPTGLVIIGALATATFVLLGKLIYDGIKAKRTDEISVQVGPAKSGSNGNGNGNGNGHLSSQEILKLIRDQRCSAHEHMASGVTESIVLDKQLIDGQKLQTQLLRDMDKRAQANFDDMFRRLGLLEKRVGDSEGDIKEIKAMRR